MSIEAIEEDFPNIRAINWRISSEIDDAYNCVAFAVHDTQQYWDPDAVILRGYYWPPDVPRDWRLSSLIRLYETQSFGVCGSGELEPEIEKIALYADEERIVQHVARQLPSGAWTSKLGPDEDIEHETLEALEGRLYGAVKVYMMRRPNRSAWE